MDRFGQIGPEKGDYEQDVARVALALLSASAVSVTLTHRGTRQDVVIALKSHMTIIGSDRDGGPKGQGENGLWLFCAVAEHGAYWFRIDHRVAPAYIAGKLGIYHADAETVAGFFEELATALGTPPTSATSVIKAVA